jgi:hypothetical protein
MAPAFGKIKVLAPLGLFDMRRQEIIRAHAELHEAFASHNQEIDGPRSGLYLISFEIQSHFAREETLAARWRSKP